MAGALLSVLLAGAGCALVRRPAAPPAVMKDGVQEGIASWYGPGFHGRQTASGERYDQHALTAAHRSLPFGSRVRVTNLHNGRTAEVRVTDRGPFVDGRVIDLSYAAAKAVGMIGSGVAPVRIEFPSRLRRSYHVEVGALSDAARAERLRQVLALRFPAAHVETTAGDERPYRVRLGPFPEDEAREHVTGVTRLGYPALLVEEVP